MQPLRKILCIMFAAASALTALAAKDVEVSGEATYYDDGRHSRVECMKFAAEQARINALAKEFGTIVTQNISQTDRISNGRETNDFLATSMTEVKGEWISDIGEPKYEYSYDAQQNLIVTCKIRGKARAISNEAASFETAVLRNGVYRRNEDTHFKSGDSMYLYFLGATDGYLMVFLEDESRNVINLLPYPHDPKGEVKVKKYEEYTFFSQEKSTREFGQVEELELTAEDYPEYNKLYVIFSPNSFSRPVMKGVGELPQMASADFSRWLQKARLADPKMGVHVINLEIAPKEFLR